ncbi:zinc ABC transporter ATP-binding protein ZnuC [Rhodovulum sp. BSW8]|uniref:ATP-binding cassette domain-containing protein n=1 Tax=Rhodovulum sp. BSW8 TaxID=2259645 RepID=UPI000DE205C5|nr:ATP-binding cassette domain-containing protein [Rhodovulum sp. BSW8]RBO53862.1 zinc ABC transporter ATP-binding protein ZnuC [Rhodovulum sp. BSW8]
MSLSEIRNATIRPGGATVLGNVSAQMTAGEIVTIVGPNGSGKSTLLRVLIGSLRPTRGPVIRRRGLRIGYVPQHLRIAPTLPLTVARLLRLRRSVGGQFRRVMLARALLAQPQLLGLDEPTQGLDQPGTAAFHKQIREVRDQTGCGILMVSHDRHMVMSASERVLCLNGHICCQGAPQKVASAPDCRALFGAGTQGTMALCTHHHDRTHAPAGPGQKAADQ